MVSIVVSTYNQPEYLRKVLQAYNLQTERRFELLIADDGSTDETREVIRSMAAETDMSIKHLWHEDKGFRKTVICNRAFNEASYDYIICTDGDCLPRKDFVEAHLRLAKPGVFLSANVLRLNNSATQAIISEPNIKDEMFSASWLFKHGMNFSRFLIRLHIPRWFEPTANRILCSNPQFNGCNSSAWKSDILRVNGYDECLSYGGQDWELGFRLLNAGVKPRKVHNSAICMHLNHDRPYATREARKITDEGKKRTLATHSVYTPHGIVKAENEPECPQLHQQVH